MFTRRLPPFEEPPRTPDEDRAVLVEGLAAVGAFAAEAGVVVLLEALNRYEDHMVNTLADAAAIARTVGSPGVRVLGDTYHMNIEEADPCAALREAADVLGAVHLSDSNRFEPGAGHVPFADILGTLRDMSFDGVLSVECRLSGAADIVVPACGAYLRGLLDGWD
jgi:sugar phosphate isomerase/epimerase